MTETTFPLGTAVASGWAAAPGAMLVHVAPEETPYDASPPVVDTMVLIELAGSAAYVVMVRPAEPNAVIALPALARNVPLKGVPCALS